MLRNDFPAFGNLEKPIDGRDLMQYNNFIVRRCVPPCKHPSPKGGLDMSEIRVGENESLESALKRFKRKCARSGVLAEVRKREHYEKPSVKRKKKAEAARRKRNKRGQ